MYDFTNITGNLQGLFATAVFTTFTVILKLILLGAAVQVVTLFLPRWLRPLAVVGALALVLAFPTQLSRAGDALLARAGLGLAPQVQAADFGLAGTAGGIAAHVQAVMNDCVNDCVNLIVGQFGLL